MGGYRKNPIQRTDTMKKLVDKVNEMMPHVEKIGDLEDLNTEVQKRLDNYSDKIGILSRNFDLLSITQGQNLIDKTKVTYNMYVAQSNGVLKVNPDYVVTDYIPVTAGATYMLSHKDQYAFYNRSKQYVSTPTVPGDTGRPIQITIPTEVSFIRISINKNNLNTVIFNSGTVLATDPSPYPYTYLKGVGANPSLMPQVKGYNELFKDTYFNQQWDIHVLNPSTYQISWKQLLRKYNPNVMRVSVTNAPPNTKFKNDYIELKDVPLGSQTLELLVEDINNNEIIRQNITIQSSRKDSKTSQQYLLMIGDSLTRDLGFTGAVISELINVTAVGIRSMNDDGIEVNEGRGGWSLLHYASEFGSQWIENPFLFPNEVSGDMYFGNTYSWKKICYEDPNGYDYKGFQLIAKDWNPNGEYKYDKDGYRKNPPTGAVMYDPTKPAGERFQQYNGTSWVAMNPQPSGVGFDFGKYLQRFKVAFGNGTKNPTIISIMLGTNDLQNIRRATSNTFTTIRNNLSIILNSIKAWNPNVKVILCIPPLSSNQDRWGDARGTSMTKWEFDENIHLFANELFKNSWMYPMPYSICNMMGILWDDVNDYGDWLHPTAQGKTKMGKWLAATIQYIRP